MVTDIIKDIEQEYLKSDIPELSPGDTVKVGVLIREGKKERVQNYEGVVIRIAGHGTSKTVTVRRVFQGVGVERIFLLHSPKVASIKVLRRGDVRQARLYYMRGRSGKAARIREKVGATLPTEPSKKKKGTQAQKPEAPAEPKVPSASTETPSEQPAEATNE